MRVRRLTAAVLAVPLVAGVAVAVSMSPASASTAITSPGPSSTFTSAPSITVVAHVDAFTGRLLLQGPGESGAHEVARGSGTISTTIGTHAVPNGVYHVTLQQSGLTGLFWYDRDSRTLDLRVVPDRPTGVSAALSGDRVTVAWKRGPEPDLTAYDIVSSVGTLARGRPVDSVCSGSTCTASVPLPASARGRVVAFGVRAHRSDGSGGSVTSPLSAVTHVAVPAGAPAAPRPRVSGAASGADALAPAGAPKGSTDGVQAVPYLPTGLPVIPDPRLTPLSSSSPLTLPEVGPDGSANPLSSSAIPSGPAVPPQPGGRNNVAAGGEGARPMAAITPDQWGISVALVLVLLLAALHVGTWSRAHVRTAGIGAADARAVTRSSGGRLFTRGDGYQGRRRRSR